MDKFEMKINPQKCTFGVLRGNFLGYMVTQRGIEANSEKVKVILHMEPPKVPEDVQRLNGKVGSVESIHFPIFGKRVVILQSIEEHQEVQVDRRMS